MLKNVEIKKVVETNEEINELFKKFDMDLSSVKKAIKSVQSQKCNWGKKKGHLNYASSMSIIAIEEQSLKNVIQFFSENKVKSYEMTSDDIEVLDEAQTIRMIKNIQSVKSLNQYDDANSDIYEKALLVEDMLKNHLEDVKELDDKLLRKSEIQQLIENIQHKETLNKEEAIKLLKGLL